MKIKESALVMSGLVFLFFILMFFYFIPLTSGSAVGDACLGNGHTCNGETVLVCINGNLTAVGKIPGQCGYEEGTPEDPSVDCLEDKDCGEDELCVNGSCILNEGPGVYYVIITLIIILILSISGVIVYKLVKKQNKKLNQNIRRVTKVDLKKKINPVPAVSLESNKKSFSDSKKILDSNYQEQLKDVQRYIPPKR